MTALEAVGLEFGYGSEPLFCGLSLAVEQGEFLGVIGPNGAGKSTLLRLFAGTLRPRAGRVLLQGRDLAGVSRLEVARVAAVVPQESHFAFDYTVLDVVLMGRHPHLGRFEQPGRRDLEQVWSALQLTDTARLSGSCINAISSGEKQRVLLARALAQEPSLLLLDEATSHLDLAHQRSMVEILGQLNRQGRTVVFLSHDLNLAALCCSRLLLLDRGRARAHGTVEDVITRELVAEVYGVEPLLSRHPQTGRPQVMLPGFSAASAAEPSSRPGPGP